VTTPPSVTSSGPPIGRFWDDPEPSNRRHRPWYRRWPIWAGVAAVVAAASVISDLPQRSTLQDRVSSAASVVKQVNTDVHPCTFAASQSFSIYHGITTGTFPAAERGFIPGYLRDDQQACSFASGTIYGMSTITLPNSSVGNDLSSLIKAELEWATSDAVGAIVDIATLVKHPGEAKALRDLAKRERLLASDRATAEGQLRAAERTLQNSALPALNLPRLAAPPHS
jgi:hypothetical protein